jgi:hypothetical protein
MVMVCRLIIKPTYTGGHTGFHQTLKVTAIEFILLKNQNSQV